MVLRKATRTWRPYPSSCRGDILWHCCQTIWKACRNPLALRTCSHAAELTAGYYNTQYRDGYLQVAQTLAKRSVILNFTCMEMKDEQQPSHANCSPELLVQQVKNATKAAGAALAGENALERYDRSAYSQVLATSRADPGIGLSAFTYLRMNKKLFEGKNWRTLCNVFEEHGRRWKKGFTS